MACSRCVGTPSIRLAVVLALVFALVARSAGAQPVAPPYPPYPPPPPHIYGPPVRYYPAPPPPPVAAPPPLPPLVRALYAPFYAAGLVLRYGVYYVLVAPLEVFSRTLEYGVDGGVEPPPPRRGEPR